MSFSLHNLIIAAERASGFFISTIKPVLPFVIASLFPPTSVTTDGFPLAIASRIVIGNPSQSDESVKIMLLSLSTATKANDNVEDNEEDNANRKKLSSEHTRNSANSKSQTNNLPSKMKEPDYPRSLVLSELEVRTAI